MSNLQRVITDDDLPDEDDADMTPVLAIEQGDRQPKEMTEADLLRALQGDRDNDSSSRF